MDVILYDNRASICCQMTRLVLAEKGVSYRKHNIDISGARNEQFEPWYVAVNPKAVVPTLQIDDEIITDTLKITPRIDASFEGPALLGDEDETRTWMARVMALHYGVLLYRDLIDEAGECETVRQRHRHLVELRDRDGDPTGLLERRIAGNVRFQAVLADPERVEHFVGEARELVAAMDAQLSTNTFLAGVSYSIADAFATAALARFEAHGYAHWWSDSRPLVAAYYARMRARPSWDLADVVTQLDWHG